MEGGCPVLWLIVRMLTRAINDYSHTMELCYTTELLVMWLSFRIRMQLGITVQAIVQTKLDLITYCSKPYEISKAFLVPYC